MGGWWRAATAIVVLLVSQRVLAAAGALDSTFGAGGVVTTAVGPDYDYLDAIVIQPDGRLVVGGSTLVAGSLAFAIARYTDAGALDPSFGTGGVAIVDFGSTSDGVHAIALQADGKIVVAGRIDTDRFALARLTPDGTLDPTFDGDGKVITVANAVNGARGMLVQSDGKIVVVGGGLRFAVARYLPSGALDPSFDGDGKAQIDVGFGSAEATAVAIQPDGRLLVTGMGPSQNFTVARITNAGAVDATFSGDGIATVDFAMTARSTQDDASTVLVQPDGRVVLGGWSCQPDACHVAMARLEADGDLDPTFSTDGKLLTRVSRDTSSITKLLLQPDGKVLAVGAAWGSTAYDELVIRYGPDGQLDTTFGGDGIVTTPIGASTNFGRDAALDARGRIVVAGYAYLGTYDWTITRRLNDPVCGDGIVDDDEQCDGGACCDSSCAFAPGDVMCRPAAGDCDVAERCSGTAAACPSDARRTDTCRPAGGPCDLTEVCDGVTSDCPADAVVADGTSCDDGIFCNGIDACTGGACRHGGDPCAAGAECADACDEAAGRCARPVDTPCTDDGSACTLDACDGFGTCKHGPGNPGLVCRASAGVCDVVERCTGVDATCPADTGVGTDADGDGICDAADVCSQAYDPDQLDRDGDGLGDACDPCTNDGTQFVSSAKLAATRLLPPPGDDTLKLSGTLTADAVDPSIDGVRVVFGDALGTLVDVAVPGGAGWKANAARTSFRFGANPGPQGIRKVTLKSVAGRWRITVVGNRGGYGGRAAAMPAWAVVALRATADGDCAEWTFPGSPGPSCRPTGGGTGVSCR